MKRDEFERRLALWEAFVHERGIPEADIQRQIEIDRRDYNELEAGRCPKCGAPVRRDYAPHQGGIVSPELGPGAWVSYRCSTQPPVGTQRPKGTCDYMLDQWESEMAN